LSIVTETKTYIIDWVALAAGVERLAMEKMKNDLEYWTNDLGMRQMSVQDAADTLAVCEVMQGKESWPAVEIRIREMDTAVRIRVYDFIEQVAGANFFDCVRA